MTLLRFLMFSTVFAVWLGAHLLAALAAVRRMRNAGATQIQIDTACWPMAEAQPLAARAAAATGRVGVSDAMPPPASRYVEAGTQSVSLTSAGRLTLGSGVSVQGFVDSAEELTIGDNTMIGQRASSRTSISLGEGVRLRAASAPKITTRRRAQLPFHSAATGQQVRIPADASHLLGLLQLSEDTWEFGGDLALPDPLLVECKLIVHGTLRAAPGSVIGDDLKASGDLMVGANSVCRGSMTSERNIELGDGVRFERTIYAGGELRLGAGVRGGAPPEVVAYARGRVTLEPNILLRGKIASAAEVVCL